MTPDRAETERFLRLMLLTGPTAAPGWICVSSAVHVMVRGEGDDDFREEYFDRGDLIGIAACVEGRGAAGRNVWINAATLRSAKRSRAQVTETWACWVDIDRVVEEAERASLVPYGFTIVESGTPGRLHVWARMAEPIAVLAALNLNRMLAMWLDGDGGKAGPESLLRVPGVGNAKPGAGPVRMLAEGRTWRRAELEGLLVSRGASASVASSGATSVASSAPTGWTAGSGELGPAPAAPQSPGAAMAAIEAQLAAVRGCVPVAGRGFRDVLNRAALVLGGYVGAGYPREWAEGALMAAVASVWGAADADDERWIRVGLDDGVRKPFNVVAEVPGPVAGPSPAGTGPMAGAVG